MDKTDTVIVYREERSHCLIEFSIRRWQINLWADVKQISKKNIYMTKCRHARAHIYLSIYLSR